MVRMRDDAYRAVCAAAGIEGFPATCEFAALYQAGGKPRGFAKGA